MVHRLDKHLLHLLLCLLHLSSVEIRSVEIRPFLLLFLMLQLPLMLPLRFLLPLLLQLMLWLLT
jgi:hypothetical protein